MSRTAKPTRRWKFAEDGVYASPYFTGDEVFPFSEFPADTALAATMEAKAYSLTFPDWKPASFKYWTADNGFVMKTRWQGTTTGGVGMGFYSYSFVNTNDAGEVLRWETHVNDEYSAVPRGRHRCQWSVPRHRRIRRGTAQMSQEGRRHSLIRPLALPRLHSALPVKESGLKNIAGHRRQRVLGPERAQLSTTR